MVDADGNDVGYPVWLGIARFLHRAGNLKRTKRTGWLDRGVPAAAAESVADHSYRVALLAWVAAAAAHPDADEPVDLGRVLLVALAHDLAEVLAGDLTPYDPEDIPESADARRAFLDRRQVRSDARRDEKYAAEALALRDLLADLPDQIGDVLRGAWQEYEERTTPVARIVRQADKLETYLQSREYLAGHPERPMASFASEVAAPETFPDPAFRSLRDAIARLTGLGAEDASPRKGGGRS